MKKSVKIFSFLLIIMVLISGVTVFAETVSVYDEVYVLDEDEFEALTEKCDRIRKLYGVDVAVVITEDLYYGTVAESAVELYVDGGFGMGDNADGIMLYICYGTNEYQIITHADGERIFNENGTRYIEEEFLPYLKDGDFYKAADVFADRCEELLAMAKEGEPYNEKPLKEIVIPIGIAVVVAVVVAFVLTKAKLSQMKTANYQTYANDYVKEGSIDISYSRDIFLYSHISRREKSKSDGKGKYTSSSGETFGGRGGSF